MFPPNKKQPQQSKTNLVGGLMVMGMAVMLFLLMIYLFSNYLFTESPLPQIQFNLNLNLNRILFISIAALLVTSVAFTIAYVTAKKTALPVVIWLDDRLLPMIKKMRAHQKKPKPEEAPKQNFWLGDPELEFAPSMATETEFGTFTTVWGETNLHENPFFPGWKPITLWGHFWTVLKSSLLATVLLTILLILEINIVSSGLSFLILFILVTYIGIMMYWAREWLRYSEFTIVTSERYIQTFGKFSWAGFLFNRGYDVDLKHNYATRIDDVDIGTTPKKLGIPISKLYEFFLERWAESESRIGTVLVRRIAQGGHDLFLNYNFAPLLKDLLIQGKGISAATARDLTDIMQKKREHVRGKPGDKTSREQRIKEADEWAAREITIMGYQPPQRFDVFEFKRNYLLKLARRTPSPPTDPTPVQATPMVFPETRADLDEGHNNTLYQDPII